MARAVSVGDLSNGSTPFLWGFLSHSPESRLRAFFCRSGQKEIQMPTELPAKKAALEWSWPAKEHVDPDLIATVLFCAIGLLVTLIVMLSFPDLGALIQQYNQF
jgi:hypothetical protein